MLKNPKIPISNFFNKGHERSVMAKKNIAASFLIKGCSIIISLALVPMTIDYVNPTQYGIWLTLASIVAWFSFFDMGFGNGMRNRFAEAKAKGQIDKARIYVSTTYAVLAIIFGAVWVLFFVANFFIDWSVVLNAPTVLAEELSKLALIIFSFFCMQIVLKTVNTVLIADQKPAKSAFFDMLGQLIALIIIFILTKTTSGSLLYLGLALGFAPVAIMIISSFWFYSKAYRHLAPSFNFVKFSFAKDILKLGIKFFLLQFFAIIIFQTNNFIIAQVIGPDSVTVFNIAYKYFGIITMVIAILVTPMWTAFTDAYTKKDYAWMKLTISKLNKIWFVFFIVAIVLIVVADFAYSIWVGEKIQIPLLVSALMALYSMVFSRMNILHYIINGVGKVRIQLLIYLIISPLYVPIAYFAGMKFGLPGIIITSTAFLLIQVVVSQYQVNLIISKKAYGIWNK